MDEKIIQKKLDRLNENSHYGIMIDTEITDIVRNHIKRLEETKMNATSTQTFKDVIAIDFELQTFPSTGEQDKFIVTARNRDDIFAFEFEGPCLVEACRKTGLFAGWEKDQKIKELEKTCNSLRGKGYEKTVKINELEEKIKKLEQADMLDKNAADYWSKEYDTLLERFKKLQVENKQNKESADIWSNEYYNLSKKFDKLKEENEKLKQLKTPTIENFADEEPADNVNHPSHYTGKYECIDVMQDVFGDEATNDFCLCNAFKYIWRARKKNGLEDVKKAVWYLKKYIEEEEKDGEDEVTGTRIRSEV